MPLIYSNFKTPTYSQPKPEIRVVKDDACPSEEMRKWLLEGKKLK